jgi:hypothetical protein
MQCQHEDVLPGQVLGQGPAGAPLPIPEDPRQRPIEGVEPAWDTRRTYLLLRPQDVPTLWVRAYRCCPATFQVDAPV